MRTHSGKFILNLNLFMNRTLILWFGVFLFSGERPYTCTECNQTFAHGSSWKTHLRLHQKMAKVVVQPEVSTIEDDESLIEILSV